MTRKGRASPAFFVRGHHAGALDAHPIRGPSASTHARAAVLFAAMLPYRLHVAFASVLLAANAWSADEAPKSSMKEILKARIAEDAKKTEARKTAPTTTSTKAESAAAAPEAKSEPTPAKASAAAAKEAPTVMPKVEVRKERITVLDQKIAQQEQDITRERKNLKVSEVDTALNDGKIAKPLSIFGGESSQFRQRVASERVELMEAEKDILEAMKRARTKEEKQELQKQLDELKTTRRELEKTLR